MHYRLINNINGQCMLMSEDTILYRTIIIIMVLLFNISFYIAFKWLLPWKAFTSKKLLRMWVKPSSLLHKLIDPIQHNSPP